MSARDRAPRKAWSAGESRGRAAPSRAARAKGSAAAAPGHPKFALPPAASLALVLGAALAVQGGALRLPFFADDYLFLDATRGRSVLDALRIADPIGNYFRPVGRQLYFWTVARLGESPVLAHGINLAAFLGVLALLFVLVRRLSGPLAATIAAAVVALSCAADVPVRWASGGQDLLATCAALGAILLFANRRRAWAALAFGLGLLAKETVVLTPLVAAAVARAPGEPWTRALRRAWPLGAVVLAWAPLWITVLPRGGSAGVHPDALAIPAALAHLAQTLLGAEWRATEPGRALRVAPPLVAFGLAAVAVAWVARNGAGAPVAAAAAPRAPAPTGEASTAPSHGHGAVLCGLIWALAGALPIAAVAPIWSAYYYLFAICGLALALGAWLAPRARLLAIALLALLAWGGENARQLDEFATAPGAWTSESHVNRFYLDRAMDRISRYLANLKRLEPTVPHRSSFFFSHLPSFLAWQAADGPLVRWAYRDTSLRSYYVSDLTLDKATRGPLFVMAVDHDSLVQYSDPVPTFLALFQAQILEEHPQGALDAITMARGAGKDIPIYHYWAAWPHRALGDTAASRRDLQSIGYVPAPGPTPEAAQARARFAAGDTIGALRLLGTGVRYHALDPEVHAHLADLFLVTGRLENAIVEAYIVHLIDPREAYGWRRWALLQKHYERTIEAYASLQRYFELAGKDADSDTEAKAMLENLRDSQPGGKKAQSSLRVGVGAAP